MYYSQLTSLLDLSKVANLCVIVHTLHDLCNVHIATIHHIPKHFTVLYIHICMIFGAHRSLAKWKLQKAAHYAFKKASEKALKRMAKCASAAR